MKGLPRGMKWLYAVDRRARGLQAKETTPRGSRRCAAARRPHGIVDWQPFNLERMTNLSEPTKTLEHNSVSEGPRAWRVSEVVDQLRDSSLSASKDNWLLAVRDLVVGQRPDIAGALERVLELESGGARPPQLTRNLLAGLTIGELGVCYEALLATVDASKRRRAGQYFTPDDAAQFMADRASSFPEGTWLDPCCGVGNLSWHLADRQEAPGAFIAERLTLVDKDPVALRSAVALLSAKYAAHGAEDTVGKLAGRSINADYLALPEPPRCDYAILNPPYSSGDAPTTPPSYQTEKTRQLFAMFMERIAKTTRGFVAVTPAAYLHAPKYASLREVVEGAVAGGDVYVFDNVPDTLFRGYKFGSTNTSKTNFVRAAITVCDPRDRGWRTTPIIRWRANQRDVMFAEVEGMLTDRQMGPHGEWAKVPAELAPTWDRLVGVRRTLADILVAGPTAYRLDVALTPRYYISAAFGPLDRRSKRTLYFASAEDRDAAAAVLNSTIPYLWWRALDGGVNLPARVLMTVPLPAIPDGVFPLVRRLEKDEDAHRVTKMNAGRRNENVKRPPELVAALDALLLPEVSAEQLAGLYANSLFG